MTDMFNGCCKLESLDLSNFKTKEVKSMKGMFKQCKALKNLDLSNFETYNVIDMSEMFSECNSLIFLNLSNFETKGVQFMYRMFYKCISLYFLNLTNFQFFNIRTLSEMFSECSSLEYLSSSRFEINIFINSKKMFYNCSFFRTLKEDFVSEMSNDDAENSIEILLKNMLFGEGIIMSSTIQNYIKEKNFNKKAKFSQENENNNICNNLIDNKNHLIQKIFQTDDFNDLNIDEFSKKYKENENFIELMNLKELIEDVILSNKIVKHMLIQEEIKLMDGV